VTTTLEHREGRDRRIERRGGRRPADATGFAPLVLVADEDAASRELCETILAKLHFAVAPVSSIEQAILAVSTLRPDVIVAHARDVSPLQFAAWPYRVPFVRVTAEMREPNALVTAIRRAIRAARTATS
jgi:PleD family two-component response regulator